MGRAAYTEARRAVALCVRAWAPWGEEPDQQLLCLLCVLCARAEHIRLKLQQHDLLRIYPNLEVRCFPVLWGTRNTSATRVDGAQRA